MTEAEWLAADDPAPMLEFLRDRGGASERKLRLFAVACYRRIWQLLTDEASRQGVAVAEAHADGAAGTDALAGAMERAGFAARWAGQAAAADAVAWACDRGADGLWAATAAGRAAGAEGGTAGPFQCVLLRCLFRQSFPPRPAPHPRRPRP